MVGLGLFTLAAGAIYIANGSPGHLWRQMTAPAVALCVVLAFNIYCQINYRRLGNIAAFNIVQLLVDIVVVTVIVYSSGGVSSWFPDVYLLIVLEAALIVPSVRQVFGIAFAAWVLYAADLLAVYVHLLPHTAVPFEHPQVEHMGSFVAVRLMWQLTVNFSIATVGTLLMRDIRARETRHASESIRDARTGMLTRSFFRRLMDREIARARISHSGLSVVMLDIDGFQRFNSAFGVEAGNAMVARIAQVIQECVAADPASDSALALSARYGGEEFAIVVPEREPSLPLNGAALGELIRVAIGDLRVDDRGVTVSVGVAAYPVDGSTTAEMVASADEALANAKESGGNRLVVLGGSPGEAAG